MSSRTKKSVSLKPRSPVSLLAYRIIQFFPRNFARVLFLWNSRQFRVISKALKCDCFFCFARLMSEFLTVGRADHLYRPIDRWWPVVRQFRSSHRFSIAIELVVHALKTARCEKQVTRPLDIRQTRSNENESARGPCAHDDALRTARLPSIR